MIAVFKSLRIIRPAFAISALFLIGGLTMSALLTEITPFKFVKLVSIRVVDDISTMVEYDMTKRFEPDEVIAKIPYRKGRIVEVHPKRRYERSILGGLGDCSNLSYGLAYNLNRSDIDYAIVHLLRTPGFLTGEGHVALQIVIDYENQITLAIVDMLEGGILVRDGKIVTLDNLKVEASNEIQVLPFHPTRDTFSSYYIAENLSSTAIGITPREEIERYFTFVEAIHVNISNKVIEKYLLDGISLLVGVFPKIYISQGMADSVLSSNNDARYVSLFLLWFVRVIVIGCAIGIVVVFYNLSSRLILSALYSRGKAR